MLNKINIEIFNAINIYSGKNVAIDQLAIIIAEYLPIIFILFLLYLWFNKKEQKNLALYFGYSSIVGVLLNFLITLFYFHPRPFMENIGTLLINHAPETSFPSDHTTFMLSIAFMLLYFKETRKTGIILSASGIVGGITRIYCGLHYPFDIVGSIIISIISSNIIFLSKEKLKKFNNFILNLYSKVIKYEN